MDRPEIVAAIRSSLFATRGMRRGYDVEAVDDALEVLIARIDAGDPAEDTERFVLGLAFPSRLGGYDDVPVDDLLDQVVAALHGRATQPSTQQGSALIAPREGFLARLLGR
ncbi:hypothetical protein [Humibacillus xanthopallidus]|uniref:hypothetical protein n=1 Tax=Humibacillus xanthopallidus TaxID=412689 RepID=UPI00384DE7A6